MARFGAHHFSGDVSRAAGAEPRRQGARHLVVARDTRHPRLGDRQAPHRRRHARRRRTRHGDEGRRARARARRHSRRRPPAPADERARRAADASPRCCAGAGRRCGHPLRPFRGRRRTADRRAPSRGNLARRFRALRRRDRGAGTDRRLRAAHPRRHGQGSLRRGRKLRARAARISAIHAAAAFWEGAADPRGAHLRRPRQDRRLAPRRGRAPDTRAAARSLGRLSGPEKARKRPKTEGDKPEAL